MCSVSFVVYGYVSPATSLVPAVCKLFCPMSHSLSTSTSSRLCCGPRPTTSTCTWQPALTNAHVYMHRSSWPQRPACITTVLYLPRVSRRATLVGDGKDRSQRSRGLGRLLPPHALGGGHGDEDADAGAATALVHKGHQPGACGVTATAAKRRREKKAFSTRGRLRVQCAVMPRMLARWPGAERLNERPPNAPWWPLT